MPTPFRTATAGFTRDIGALTGVLRALPKDVQKRILAPAVKAACQPIEVAAKRFARRSEDTGALRQSIATKVKAYPTGVVVGLVGPRRDYFVRGRKVTAFGAILGRKELRRPANYAHLVEFGHRIAVGGRLKREDGRGRAATGTEGGFVPARPFIRPAVITTRAAQQAAFDSAIAAGLARETRRLTRAA